MPRQVSWIHRISGALERLEGLSSPPDVIDRACVERLFELSPRQALRVLISLGAVQAGRSAVLGRARFEAALRQLVEKPAIRQEVQRRTRLEGRLSELQRLANSRRVVLGSQRQLKARGNWAEGMHLSKGRFEIEFDSPEELLRKLWVFMESVSADLEGFRKMATQETHELLESARTP